MKKVTFSKRIIAWILSLALIFSVIPVAGMMSKASAAGVDAGIVSAVVDGSTLQSWKDAFDPANLSTEHAGGVWTDKSVIKADSITSVFGNIAGLEAAPNNFLVALSAMGANSVIVGQGTMPTDTVFVLDISGSMSSTELSAMVTAANDAIHTLLTGNEKNRVGVVLYSTSASVLLELGRYTPVVKGQDTQTTTDDSVDYIELTNSYIRTARLVEREWVQNNQGGGFGGGPGGGGYWQETVTAILKDSLGNSVDTSVRLTGGTYIQGGLWKAWEQFNSASVTDERTPVLVLMSDGAPTFTSNDYNNVPDSYEEGTGNDSYDGDGFLTQLTAAYVKEKMADKYSTASYTAIPYFYTLGLGVSGSGNTVTVAQAVLDTTKERTDMETYWDSFLTLAAAGNKTMSVTVGNAGYGSDTTNVTVTYDATVTASSREYVNKAFSADNASGLSTAFQGIVSEISLKAGYYVTRLDGTSSNSGGYVTFVDEIGTGMEFKELEGVLIGNTLYTGEKLAKAAANGEFGTEDVPTTLGDNLVWSVKERFRIADTAGLTATQIARNLLEKAFAKGQIGYDSQTGKWSNYIAWFGNAKGEYIGFWDNADPNAAIPEGAVYANICYGLLGTTTDSQTAHASDMLYLAIQVSKKITEVSGKKAVEAKTPQTVTFRIPAALLPTVTYQISVEAENGEQITTDTPATLIYNAAEPIRLVYEVGVHSALTPENIHEFVRAGYQAKDANGNYYLYTNAWNWTPVDGSAADFNNPPTSGSEELKDTGKNAITYAYFEPGENNEHYYFTENSLVYVKSGSAYVPYEGDTKPNGKYYFRHLVYSATADSTEPSKEVTAKISEHYEELSGAALQKTVQTSGAKTWYVPEGTMHRNTHDHNRDKTDGAGNITESFFAINHQLVDTAVNGDTSHHYEIVYMGNNGRVTYSPAQGFSLTKDMVQGETAEGQTFTFTVTVTGDTDGKVTVTRDGVGSVETLSSGTLQLTLRAGQTVEVTGIDVGATYTIRENDLSGYRLSEIAARAAAVVNQAQGTVRDTVEENEVFSVTYTNAIQHYGTLHISKEVQYMKNSQPAGANTAKFPVKVTFAGMGGQKVFADGAAVTLDASGAYSFDIIDGQLVSVTGIPEGVAYTVTELVDAATKIPNGYDADDGYTATAYSFSGTIVKNSVQTAPLKNQYTPADLTFNNAEPKITAQVKKTLSIGSGSLSSWSFDFELLHYNYTSSAWEAVKVNGTPVKVTVDHQDADGTAELSMAGVTLTYAGEHYFRVAEVIPQTQMSGMTYDRTFHDFKITVVDDLSGQLKIQSVEKVQHAQVTQPNAEEDAWTVNTSFTNTFSASSTKLTIQANKKLFNNTTGTEVEMGLKDGQFQFTLYSADQNFENLSKIEDSANGIAGQIIFAPIVYEYSSTGSTYYYVVKETTASGNGYSVDGAQYKIAVTVTPGSNGSEAVMNISKVTVQKNQETVQDITSGVLSAGNVLNGTTISFKNVYTATPAQVQISGTKNLKDETPGANGAALTVPNGLFTFKLTALGGAPLGAGNTTGSTTVTNTGSGFTFPQITYTTTGLYHYTVTEEAVTASGYQKDTAVHNITVHVTDDGAGKLTAAVLYNGGAENSAVFNNTYTADPVTNVVLQGGKTLNVDTTKFTRTLKAGDFSFVLTRPDGTTETVTNDASGNFSFSALRFDTLGSYEYTIQEIGAGTVRNGVTYDSAYYKVTVTVTDTDKDGKQEAAVAYQKVTDQAAEPAGKAAFVNTYTAKPVPVQLSAHKYLVGIRDLKEKEFRFTMTKPGGTTETKWNAADGTVLFDPVTYSAAGTYVYTVVEDKVDENGNPLTPDQNGNYIYNGVQYTQVVYTVTVKVVDNGSGSLVAHVTSVDNHGNAAPVQFFNRYEATPVTVNLTGENGKLGSKTLEDRTGNMDTKDLSDFDFRFVLTDKDGNEIETVSDNNVNGFKFTDIEYTQPGETVYYIHERNTAEAGVSYDTSIFKVTVTVTDNGVGQLSAQLSYEKITTDINGVQHSQSVQEIAFANVYEADPAGLWINGHKVLTNETPGVMNKNMPTPAGKFHFKLTALNGAPMAAGNTAGYEIVNNDADGNFAFSVIHYTQEGTYRYTITEEAPNMPGVTKDDTVHNITVVVTDNGSGQLVAAITYDNQADNDNAVQTVFHNTYKAAPATGIVLSGNKELVGNTMKPGDFSFTLTKPEGSPETVSNDETGRFAFSALSFDKPGTYTYKITEVGGGSVKNGIAYDGKTITVVIVVEDNGSGQLVAKVDKNEVTAYHVGSFKNIYAAQPVTVNLTGANDKDGVKTLTDKSSLVDKTLNDFAFKFVLTDELGNVMEIVSDNGSGFNFADITYDKPTEKVYYIFEQNENIPGVIYDSAKYKVIVKVTDNKLGQLVAAVSYEKFTKGSEKGEIVDAVTFANIYEAQKTSVTFAGNKTLLGGRDQKAGEFSFILKDAAGKEIETVCNDANGKFTFTTIEYTQEGTYVYDLTEVAGTDSTVTYDATKYVLTVTVKDVDGELKAATQITADGKPAENYGFTNLYTPENIQTTFTVEKILVNKAEKPMGLDGFRFDLTCVETGKMISILSGDDGLAKFDLSFTSADVGKTYTYQLAEHAGSVEGMVYSDVVYEIKIAITQNAQTGKLELTVTRDGKAVTENATFVNTYNKVTPSEDESPKTGDDSLVGGWILLMTFSAVAMLAVLVLGKETLLGGKF